MKKMHCTWRRRQIQRWKLSNLSRILLIILCAEVGYLSYDQTVFTPFEVIREEKTIEIQWNPQNLLEESVFGIRYHKDEISIEFYRMDQRYEEINPD